MSEPLVNIVMDVDTGIDDAMAIAFAMSHPRINVVAISCVAGNTSLPQVVANTLAILDAVGAPSVPVVAGAAKPLFGYPRAASHVHGPGGLGDVRLPPSERVTETGSAVEVLHRIIRHSPDPVTIVALAPLTNIALLLTVYPDLADRIDRIVFMGGAIAGGNATAVAEFNVWHDPEATHLVLNSGIPITMYSLDAFERVVVDLGRAQQLASSTNPKLSVIGKLLLHRSTNGTDADDHFGLIGDAGAITALLNPSLACRDTLSVHVDISHGPGRGQTLVDRRARAGEDSLHRAVGESTLVDVISDVNHTELLDAFVSTVAANSRGIR